MVHNLEDPSTFVDMGLFPAAQLPGEDLVRAGLDDLRRGEATVAALLVSVGAPRLRLLGLELPETFEAPEDTLFALLERGPRQRPQPLQRADPALGQLRARLGKSVASRVTSLRTTLGWDDVSGLGTPNAAAFAAAFAAAP
jgi:hypothetical protein